MAKAQVVGPAAAGAAAAAALALGVVPPCPLHATTGLWCPLCGSTRATRALLHGHLAQALRWNPVILVTLGVLAWGLAAWAYPALRVRVPVRLAWWAAGLLVAFAVARNLPGLAVLAPPN